MTFSSFDHLLATLIFNPFYCCCCSEVFDYLDLTSLAKDLLLKGVIENSNLIHEEGSDYLNLPHSILLPALYYYL